ncbi:MULTISPECIES: hypothetical protein [unclassified Cryobacterium]|uniref:hypothetical protein n=1 Tax=unclassified Cryobacterium TaxID=2649013 RepID=UPI0010694BCF|nr:MULTISPECIES: hypothetical protein [unclassified Cryobacterium]TFD03508.1 hypothetical protein E3T29_16860 [Cryobacterium sp. TMT1-66-1]TFD12771.1 hypothetical protein E3T35_05595 [Cryobacterium sp. TMT1-2-2]
MASLAAWEAALDDLENRLDAAARSMAVSTGSNSDGVAAVGEWTVPTRLGNIPPELATRVQDLLHNQQKLIGELEQARTLTLKHLTAVRSVPPERDARASVYLDVAG